MKRVINIMNEVVQKHPFCAALSDEDLQHLKSVFLGMYKDIYAVCSKYNLTVMLNGGTALGAVRHQGFIPWDDDLDLMLPREDYNKLIEVFDAELGEKYDLSVPGPNRTSDALFMRILKKGTIMRGVGSEKKESSCGIRIDIHPIDRMPDNKFCRDLKCKLLNLIRICALSVNLYQQKSKEFKAVFMFSRSTKIYYWVRWSIGLVCSIFGRDNWYRFFVRVSSSSKGEKYICIPSCALCEKELQPREVFFPPRKAVFEGLEVYIPNDYDTYLRKQYGDYMTLPPEEKRQRHYYLQLDFGEE